MSKKNKAVHKENPFDVSGNEKVAENLSRKKSQLIDANR